MSAEIRAICAGCPVRAACLTTVMAEEHGHGPRHGFRAGLAPEERAAIARTMRRHQTAGRAVSLDDLAQRYRSRDCRSCGRPISRGWQFCDRCRDAARLRYFRAYDRAHRQPPLRFCRDCGCRIGRRLQRCDECRATARRRSYRESKRRLRSVVVEVAS